MFVVVGMMGVQTLLLDIYRSIDAGLYFCHDNDVLSLGSRTCGGCYGFPSTLATVFVFEVTFFTVSFFVDSLSDY